MSTKTAKKKTRKAGRPSIGSQVASRVVSAKLTPATYARIESAAGKYGMTVSLLIRQELERIYGE